MTDPQPPANMIVVTKEQFYDLLRADPRDIMSSVRHPDFTTWETPSREVWGWSAPGWLLGGDPRFKKVYAVISTALKKG